MASCLFTQGVRQEIPRLEPRSKLVWFPLNHIGNELPKDRSEFESMPASPCRNEQSRVIRMAIDPEMFVESVRIKTTASVNDSSIKLWKCFSQKINKSLRISLLNNSFILIGVRLQALAMVAYL
jgi:hypothetical protein